MDKKLNNLFGRHLRKDLFYTMYTYMFTLFSLFKNTLENPYVTH
jgi:hypothetical protein